jgi:hypothetical protein
MDLTIEEYQKAKKAGYSTDRIAQLLTLDAPKKSVTTQAPKASVQSEIATRGNVWENIKNDFMSPNPIRRYGMAPLAAVASPLTAIENTVANPALAMQRGNFNPMDLAKEAYQGMTGQKQGQYGDVFREAGVPKPIAATAGFVLNASPIKMANMASKALSGISKMSDKGILKAGNSLIKATSDAEKFAGTKVNEAYAAFDEVKIGSDAVLKELNKLPAPLIKKVGEVFGGTVEELSQNMTVGSLRKVKQLLGKYKPGAFSKSERGAAENIEADEIESVYGAIKNLLSNNIKAMVGEKATSAVMKLDEAFTNISRASDSIKKTVVDPTLLMATKAGKMAGKLSAEGDVTGRMALNIVRNSSKEAKKSIDVAVKAMSSFNKWRAVSEAGRKVVNAAAFGGVAGSLGGLALGKLVKRDSD